MFLTNTRSGYDRGGQVASGLFLVVFSHNKFKWAEENGCHWDKFPSDLNRVLYACVRRVALRQLGHWMMGTARIGGHSLTVSGSYGGDGLTCDYEKLPKAARAKLVRLPDDLTNEFWAGGGHNTSGAEAPAMRKWAMGNLDALKGGK
jgi:hypothetical protein